MTSLEAICATAALLSLAHLGWAHRCFGKWARERPHLAPPEATPPITFLRPLKPCVASLRTKLEAMAAALRPADQLIFGADRDSAEAAICEEVRAAFPDRDIVVVPCVEGAAWNPKISKLVQMEPHVRNGHLVLADSEATLDRAFVAELRGEWAASGADVLTVGYGIRGVKAWPERLDAAALLVTLWPGLAVMDAAGAIRFTLGACTALRRADLVAVGGWMALGGELAEDNRLGVMLAGAGRSIRLSSLVVSLGSDRLSWRDWWRHQLRVAVTYRAGNPWGFAGSIFTHGEAWSLALLGCGEGLGAALFFAVWLARTAVTSRMARRLGFDVPALALAVLGASLAATVGWALSWGLRTVWWSGRRWRVDFRGRLAGI